MLNPCPSKPLLRFSNGINSPIMLAMVRYLAGGIAALSLLVATATPAPKAPPAPPKYGAVQKVLKAKCVGCHTGAGAAGGLDLTSFKNLMKGGHKGKAVVAGKPEKSDLVAYITGKKKPQMPIGGKPLAASEVKLIQDWIKAGAKEK